MVKTVILTIAVLFLAGTWGCDFFIASSFPDYLTTASKVENLGKYFGNSNAKNYDMFVIQDDAGEDYVFVLYKPNDTERKVVVFDSNLNYATQYEDPGLGSLHTGYLSGQRALVGSLNVALDNITFPWDKNTNANIQVNEIDNLMVFNNVSPIFYMLFVTATGNDIQSSGHDDDIDLSTNANGDGLFTLSSTAEEYILENACYLDNGNPVDSSDDIVILFLRRRADNEGLALGISADDFPDAVAVAGPALENYPVFSFGKIKPGSVNIVFGGRGVVLEHEDGEVNLYEIFIDMVQPAIFYNNQNDTKGRQFEDKVVAYSRFKPDYYVFDPATKDLFRCDVWWK